MTNIDKHLRALMRNRVQEPPNQPRTRRQTVGRQRFEFDLEGERALAIRRREQHVVMLPIVSARRDAVHAQERAGSRAIRDADFPRLRRQQRVQLRELGSAAAFYEWKPQRDLTRVL